MSFGYDADWPTSQHDWHLTYQKRQELHTFAYASLM
jgi:hypothetical protein